MVSQLLFEKFRVGLRWEPLLGLERESKEIRTLLARRSVTRYAVFAGEMGARTLGLVQAKPGPEPEPGPGPGPQASTYSFLCTVAAALKQRSFLFVHPHPDDPTQVILASVRDDRPELDDIFDAAQATAAVGRFLGGGGLSEVMVAGMDCACLPNLVINKAISLEELLTGAAQDDLKQFAIASLKAPISFKFKPLPAALLLAVFIAVGATAWWAMSDDELEMPAIDMTHTFQSRLTRALLAETSVGGPRFARAVEDAVRNVSVDVHGWRAMTITCGDTQCVVDRRRQVGADATAMLATLKGVRLEGLDQALEIVPLPIQDAQVPDVYPTSKAEFSSRTAARMQLLGDYGLAPTLEEAQPIVPVPASVASAASLTIVKRGSWSLGGDLAFLDSMTGMIVQSENMVLKSLQVDLAAAQPSFTAKGYYYVE